MFWISTLALITAAAFFKLGIASMLVTVLTAALGAAFTCLVALALVLLWQLRRRAS